MDDAQGENLRPTAEQPGDAKLDWISWALSRIAYTAALRPRSTLSMALLLTACAAALALTKLEFRTSRLDLLSDSAGYNQRWLNYLARFGHDDDAAIVISHTQSQRVAEVLTAVGQRLENDSKLSGVLYRKSVGSVADKALHLMPAKELSELDQLLQACTQLLTRTSQSTEPTSPSLSGAIPASFSGHLSAALSEAQSGLDRLQQAVPKQGPLLLEDEGKLGICLVTLPHSDDKPKEAAELMARLSDHLDALRSENPNIDIWLTGMPILEWDESQSSQRDMRNATFLSLLGVAVIFGFGFGSWRMPCAAVACMTIGLIWTVGLTTLCIGHLNLFSVAFGAIIAGLGIDYSIHVLTHLTAHGCSTPADQLPQRLCDAVAKCGRGVFTGAITTSAAFGVAMLTPFRGMTELGAICAMGTLSCMAVTIWVLPALLSLQNQWWPVVNRKGRIGIAASAHRTLQSGLSYANDLVRRQRIAVLVSVSALSALAAINATRLHYDHNLLNLQAEGIPSVHAERELTRRSGQSAWFAISLADSPQRAQAMHQRLASLPSVARVEDLGSVLANASTHPQTQQLVAQCREQANQIARHLAADTHPQPTLLPTLGTVAVTTSSPAMIRTVSHNADVGIDLALCAQMRGLATSISNMAAQAAPTLADFPLSVRQRMASQDGQTFLLRIFARENLWQRENLEKFVGEVESVDPQVTGHPIQTWYASGELENSYYQAGLYALLIIAALLMIDLGSVRMVLLAMLPVALSLIQLCGLLVWLEIPFNAANMIVLPLILGIGVDDGVHIVHDFRTRSSRGYQVSRNTTLAVLLTSLTTMVGFGSMGLADHRGLHSLGVVLLLGVGLCWMNSWFTLPALLSCFGPPRSELPFGHPLSSPSTASSLISTQPSTVSSARLSTVLSSQDSSLAMPQASSLLLSEIPILLSLPSYPETSH